VHVQTSASLTRFLLLVLVIVLARWGEMRTGWPEAATIPLAALLGLAALEVLVMPRDARLGARGWGLTLAVALGMAALLSALVP
jgi:hypothetical protein